MCNNGVKFHSGAWKGLVADQEWAAIFQDLDKWLADNPGEMVVHYDCRDVRRIQTPKGVVYLKDIRHLTDAGMHKQDRFSWCKWIFRGSRAIETWDACQALLKSGFQCPSPLLAVRCRNGITPRDIFVSAAVELPNLWDVIPEGMDAMGLAEMLGESLQVFHSAGFAHGDCILRNLCYDDEGKCVVYLDNDRTWLPPFFFRQFQQKRNLAQMSYSILKRFDEATSRHFLECYARANSWPGEAEIQEILNGAIARRDRKKRKE